MTDSSLTTVPTGRLAQLVNVRAPLIPVALAATAGIIIDRYFDVPMPFSLLAATLLLIAATVQLWRPTPLGPPLYLCAALAAGTAAYHNWHCTARRDDDVAFLLSGTPQPLWLRGVINDRVEIHRDQTNPLSAYPAAVSTRFVLRTAAFRSTNAWRPASGLVQVIVEGELPGTRRGDAIELIGRLAAPETPGNPGEFDYAGYLRDRGIRGVMQVENTTAAVTRLPHPGIELPTLSETLDRVHTWARSVLAKQLPSSQHGVANVLLLGDEETLDAADWEKYLVTGTVHVLAISGQHLAVLGGFVWLALRLAGVRRGRGAVCVALFALGYALMVGGRPPVLRAAGMVAMLCGGLLSQRPALPANSFAFTWLAVLLLNPTDIFNTGCQLSFLAVAMLLWGAQSWSRRHDDPLVRELHDSRPLWQRLLLGISAFIAIAYMVNAAVWFAVLPLIAARHHLVSPVAILIGPPMILFSSSALVCGFVLLLGGAWLWPLSAMLAALMSGSLWLADWLVNLSRRAPGAYFYVPDIPGWLLLVFYAGLFALLISGTARRHWQLWLAAALIWCGALCLLWLLPRTEPFRCCFLSVGHGGCTVIETRGQVLVYDAGAITGPEITRRIVAPYLWRRNITRIDELFISHADLDHFNGIPDLLERFAVRRVHLTPSFSDRQTPAAKIVLDHLHRRNALVHVISAGQRLHVGEASIDVLHPPEVGPAGRENVRSLVLLCRVGERSLLLTGDLEEQGLQRLLSRPPMRLDVLMAPHHGSKAANTPTLAAWARPQIVVSCQGRDWRSQKPREPYTVAGAEYLPTWPHGAVDVRLEQDAFVVTGYRSKKSLRLAGRAGP